jgi:hypothetical protein
VDQHRGRLENVVFLSGFSVMNPLSAHTIDNFLSGKATPDEKAQVEAWYETCQKKNTLMETLTKEEQEKTGARMWDTISKIIQLEHVAL